MSALAPRAAYCTGCDTTFKKMYLLIHHRRLNRCGGRFLPEEERERLKKIRLERESVARKKREEDRLDKRTPAEIISERRRNFLDGR